MGEGGEGKRVVVSGSESGLDLDRSVPQVFASLLFTFFDTVKKEKEKKLIKIIKAKIETSAKIYSLQF